MKISNYLFGFFMMASAATAQAQSQAPNLPPQAQAAIQAQTGRPAAATPAAPAPATKAEKDLESGYVLGPDDTVEISVLGQPEFQTRARVRANGTVQLPFIGEQKVAGETALTLAPKIADKLRAGGYYSKPVVNIEITGFSSRYVTLLGAVAQSGLQPVDRSYRLSEIIARAGGIRETGADFITLTRADGTQKDYPFEKLATGGPADDPVVNPGDKIYVPEADLFYIYGQVNAPGVYPIRSGSGAMTVRKAIARGAGFTAAGSPKRIKLYRDGQEQKADLDMTVKPGDVFVVGERAF
ncbi:MAG: polysaccharide biosynthesis/export family protein [Proteobacteria bacterium]|nr:polysaccharide biosynthesis/export family protein [Pseudomonadota bacterium]